MKLLLLATLIYSVSVSNCVKPKTATAKISIPKIAIIGKNNPGALCSYYLHKIIGKVEIDIYDHPGKPKEFISVYRLIHKMDENISKIFQEIKVELETSAEDEISTVLYDEENNDPFQRSIVEKKDAQSYEKLENFILSELKKIYQFPDEENEKSFKSISELFSAMNPEFLNYMKMNFFDLLKSKNLYLPKELINYVKGSIMDDYMDYDAHALAILLSMKYSMAAGNSDLMVDSDEIIMKKLLNDKDQIINEPVVKISRNNQLNFISTNSEFDSTKGYNFVIFATSIIDNIAFTNYFQDVKNKFLNRYIDYYAIMVTGELNPKCVGPQRENTNLIKRVLNIQDEQMIEKKVDGRYAVYGPKEPLMSAIEKCINNLNVLWCKMFNSRPSYSNYNLVQNAYFDLGKNIYNVRAGDLAHMSWEMFAISSKNVASLIKNKILNKN